MKNLYDVFATPDAYELLCNSENHLNTKLAIESLFEATKFNSLQGLFIENCSLAISILWAKHQSEITKILLYKHDGHPIYHIMNLEMFYETLEKSIQIHFD